MVNKINKPNENNKKYEEQKLRDIFSERLGDEMSKQKITAKVMSKDLAIGEATISQYKNGTMEPSISKLKKIANYLGVSSDYMLGEVNYKTKNKNEIGKLIGLSDAAIDILYLDYGKNSECSEGESLSKLLMIDEFHFQVIDEIPKLLMAAENSEFFNKQNDIDWKYEETREEIVEYYKKRAERHKKFRSCEPVQLNPNEYFNFLKTELKKNVEGVINQLIFNHIEEVGIEKIIERIEDSRYEPSKEQMEEYKKSYEAERRRRLSADSKI